MKYLLGGTMLSSYSLLVVPFGTIRIKRGSRLNIYRTVDLMEDVGNSPRQS